VASDGAPPCRNRPGEEGSYDDTCELAFADGIARFSQDGVIDPPTRVSVDGDLLRFEWAEREWMMSVTSSLENGALRFRELSTVSERTSA
jgi:hypothetical protein